MKKQFKKLLKKADKSRAKHGFSNEGVSKTFVQIKPDQNIRNAFKVAIAFDDAVQELRHDKGGIPEFLDKKCLQDTGFRVSDLTDFYREFTCRISMLDPNFSEEKCEAIMFDHFETFSTMIDGKAEIVHTPYEQHLKYLRGYKQFKSNPQAVYDFVYFFLGFQSKLNEKGKL